MSEISGGGGGLSYSKEHGLIWEYLCEEESDFIFDEIFVKQVYARHGIVISEGSTVIDVGANIGLFSLFCIQQTKSINILCIEPLPPNFKALKRNLADYARKSNDKYCIAFEECAVGNCSEGDSSSDFYFFPGNPGESTRYPLEQLNQRNILLNAALDCGIDEIKDIALQQLKNRNIYSMHNNFDSDQHCGLNLHERVLLDATDERQTLKSSPTHGLDNDDNNINISSSSSSSSNNNNDNNNNNNNNDNHNNNNNNNSNNNNDERQEKSTKSPASEIIPNNSKFKCRIKTLEKIIIEQNILSIDLMKVILNRIQIEKKTV